MNRRIVLGLRANWQQFTLLVIVNAFVGAMVGLERAIIPLIAGADFQLTSNAAALSFLVSFGVVKALANLFAGRMSDRVGRKRILVAGWLAGLPVPVLIMFAPTWGWIVFANMLLGINQGLCWSTTVIMKIDLVGPQRRGLAMGLNEATDTSPFHSRRCSRGIWRLSMDYARFPFARRGLCPAGLLLSTVFVRETQPYAPLEARQLSDRSATGPSGSTAIVRRSPVDHQLARSRLFAVSQAGLVNNLNDGLVWGLLPIYLTARRLPLPQVVLIAAVYPFVWGLSQLLTGALSDRVGRKPLIVGGMWVQAIGIASFVVAQGFWPWLSGAVLLGLGTALVYPTLLAAVSDVAHPDWRASAVGVYRLWRDGGYAVGAILAGLLADAFSIPVAIVVSGGSPFYQGQS
jgi:MFS family permease